MVVRLVCHLQCGRRTDVLRSGIEIKDLSEMKPALEAIDCELPQVACSGRCARQVIRRGGGYRPPRSRAAFRVTRSQAIKTV
jgi:hypothetical protein